MTTQRYVPRHDIINDPDQGLVIDGKQVQIGSEGGTSNNAGLVWGKIMGVLMWDHDGSTEGQFVYLPGQHDARYHPSFCDRHVIK